MSLSSQFSESFPCSDFFAHSALAGPTTFIAPGHGGKGRLYTSRPSSAMFLGRAVQELPQPEEFHPSSVALKYSASASATTTASAGSSSVTSLLDVVVSVPKPATPTITAPPTASGMRASTTATSSQASQRSASSSTPSYSSVQAVASSIIVPPPPPSVEALLVQKNDLYDKAMARIAAVKASGSASSTSSCSSIAPPAQQQIPVNPLDLFEPAPEF